MHELLILYSLENNVCCTKYRDGNIYYVAKINNKSVPIIFLNIFYY